MKHATSVPTPDEVRELRSTLKMTQLELSRFLGLGDLAIRHYEAGTAIPSRSACRIIWTYQRLVRIYDMLEDLRRIEREFGPTPTIDKSLTILNECLP